MRNVTLVSAGPKDIPALADLLGLLFASEADFWPSRKKQLSALHMILAHPNSGRIFVARVKGRIAGMVNLRFLISTAEGGKVIQLEDLIVHPDFRGRGLGTRLLRHAIFFTHRKKFKRITLLTDAVNAAAQSLYRRHGFKPSAMIPLRLHLS